VLMTEFLENVETEWIISPFQVGRHFMDL